MKKTAIVAGATGLIGSYLFDLLIQDNRYEKIVALVRKPLNTTSSKVEVVVADFSELSKSADKLKGNDLFCCIGTTIKKAGNREAFREVDYSIPVNLARLASANNVESFLVVSSLGSSAESGNFYLQTKGKMEEEVQRFSFKKTAILRPSLLLGDRKEFRLGERIGQSFMNIFGSLFIGKAKKYRGIHAETVARAMIHIANSNTTQTIFESEEIQVLGDK